MSDEKIIDILKNAILLEKRGFAFYDQVAKQTNCSAVKDFFEHMAQEETTHVDILSEQFKSFNTSKEFNIKLDKNKVDYQNSFKVLSKQIIDEITAASYEAAAICAAMNMEKNAIKLYSDRSIEATNQNEKELYKWLSEWEEEHLRDLSTLNSELQQKIWHDNNFWPM